MIIKAIIEELPEPGDNHYMIRIPFMEDHTKNKRNNLLEVYKESLSLFFI